MLTIHEFDDRMLRKTVEQQEIPAEIRSAAPRVAVIATQDWCPDWKWMDQWLQKEAAADATENSTRPDVSVYVVVYNKRDLRQEFMQLKETVWENGYIPYVRYYRDGAFAGDSNQVSRDAFYQRFE